MRPRDKEMKEMLGFGIRTTCWSRMSSSSLLSIMEGSPIANAKFFEKMSTC